MGLEKVLDQLLGALRLILEGIGYNLIDNKYKGFRDERYNRGLNEVRRMFYGRITVEF